MIPSALPKAAINRCLAIEAELILRGASTRVGQSTVDREVASCWRQGMPPGVGTTYEGSIYLVDEPFGGPYGGTPEAIRLYRVSVDK